jgi:hypothetical protein
MLHLSTADRTIQLARELTHALCNPAPAAPFAHIGYEHHEALAKLANIFEEIADPEPVHDSIQYDPPSEHPRNIPSLDPMRAP